MGSSESTLVKMPHCWKSHVVAHIRKSIIYKQSHVWFRTLHKLEIKCHIEGKTKYQPQK